MSDYYDILGVSKDSDASVLKKAYRKLAMKHHPDKGGDQDKFKQINEAYSVLSDENKRSIYNKYGKDGVDGMEKNGNVNPNDIFNQFFGGQASFGFNSHRGGQPRQKRCSDSIQIIKVSLEDICSGKTKNIMIERKVVDQSKISKCQNCKGNGIETILRQIGPGMITQQQRHCATCNGTGFKASNEAFKRKKETIQLNIEPGCPEGIMFVYHGLTNEEPGKKSGNLIFKIQYNPHKVFDIFKNTLDLEANIKINLFESLNGFTRTMLHPKGHKLTVTSSLPINNGKYCIPNEGIAFKDKCGSLFVNIDIEFPKRIHDKSTLQEILGQTQNKDNADGRKVALQNTLKPYCDIRSYVERKNIESNQQDDQENNSHQECQQS